MDKNTNTKAGACNLKLGIDDSGRGPVIGPMILAGCLIDEEIEKEFKKLGVKDSKLLTPKRREVLAELVKEKAITFEITITHPDEITQRNHSGVNLNTLEAIKAAEIINKINKGLSEVLVIVDCPSPNIKAWQGTLERYIHNKSNLIIKCEHKADKNHLACSAASIIAKHIREKEIAKIKEKIGKDFGSGYVHDPKTCEFLEKYSEQHKKDGIFRETWQTWKNQCAKNAQKKLEF